jgi:hypothetical protein
MTRLLGFLGVLGISISLAASASSQPAPPSSLQEERSDCGFSIGHPKEWAKYNRKNDDKLELDTNDELTIGVVVGPITQVSANPEAGEMLAQAAAGEYCLTCLRNKLVWVDRFIENGMTVSYTVQADADKIWGQIVAYYYLRFFLFTQDAPGRNPGNGAWTRAELNFYVPAAQYHQTEPVIQQVVRSFRFTQPQKAVCRW